MSQENEEYDSLNNLWETQLIAIKDHMNKQNQILQSLLKNFEGLATQIHANQGILNANQDYLKLIGQDLRKGLEDLELTILTTDTTAAEPSTEPTGKPDLSKMPLVELAKLIPSEQLRDKWFKVKKHYPNTTRYFVKILDIPSIGDEKPPEYFMYEAVNREGDFKTPEGRRFFIHQQSFFRDEPKK